MTETAPKITPMDLQRKAHRIRRETFRRIHEAGGGHFGGTLSLSEILTVLYFRIMRIDPARPDWEARDRLVLSKGHGGPALYVTLADVTVRDARDVIDVVSRAAVRRGQA